MRRRFQRRLEGWVNVQIPCCEGCGRLRWWCFVSLFSPTVYNQPKMHPDTINNVVVPSVPKKWSEPPFISEIENETAKQLAAVQIGAHYVLISFFPRAVPLTPVSLQVPTMAPVIQAQSPGLLKMKLCPRVLKLLFPVVFVRGPSKRLAHVLKPFKLLSLFGRYGSSCIVHVMSVSFDLAAR